MKKILYILLLCSSFGFAQNVMISPSGITPALTGTYPRISYDEILALSSPVAGDQAYDLTFQCMRVYNGTRWVCTYQIPSEPVADGAFIASAGGTSYDIGESVAIDASGNVYITGYYSVTITFGLTSKVSAGQYDIFIAKYNSSGVLQWVQSAGGDSNDYVKDISVDISGNVYITGYYYGTATFGAASITSAGSQDIYIAKYNSSGVLQWVQSEGGTATDRAYSITVDASGNVYITGYYEDTATFGSTSKTSEGVSDIFIAKYNSSGSLQWVQSAGGASFDVSYGIALDISGNVYVTGYYYGTAAFGVLSKTSAGQSDIFIAKYSPQGESWSWVQSAGGASFDLAYDIALDISGNIHLTGSYQGTATFGATSITSNGNWDVYVAKYNSSGNFQWVQSAGGTSDDNGRSVALDGSGNVYMTGEYRGTATFESRSKTSSGDTDIYIAKYNSNGNLQWVQSAGGTSTDMVSGMALDTSENVYITGYYYSTAIFGATSKTSIGNTDVFLARISQ